MKNKTILIAVVAIIIIAGVWYFQSDNVPISDEPIKIGAIYAVTGPAAKFGEISIKGVKDGATYFEEITGQKVEVLVEDTAGDSKQGVSAATKLFNVDNVKFAVIGTSAVSAAVAPIAETAKSLLISDAALLGLTKDKQYTLQNFMPSLADISKQINKNDSWQKVAVVYVNDEFGTVWNKNITSGLSNRTTENFSFEKATTDYRTQALKIKQFAPDVAVVIGYGPALNQVLADFSLNKIEAPIISYLACTLPGVLTDERFSLEGQYSYEYPAISNKKIRSWIESHDGELNTFYTLAFENTILALTAALESGGNTEESITYLKEEGVSGLWGDVRFDASGVVNRDLVLTKINNGVCAPANN